MPIFPIAWRYCAQMAGLCACAAVAAMSLAVFWNAPFFFEGLLWFALALILLQKLPEWIRSTRAAQAALIEELLFRLQDPYGPRYTPPHGTEGIL